MRTIALLLLCSGSLSAQTTAPTPTAVYQGLDAVAWVQTSAEYQASGVQVYRSAERALRTGLRAKNQSAAIEQTERFRALPPAVILDLDETVLDNSSFQVPLVTKGKPYSDGAWDAWVKEMRAGLVPGAKRFLQQSVLLGVTPLYVTNRSCDVKNPEDPTIKVLRLLEVPLARPDKQLHCKEDVSDKGPRRARLAKQFRIVLLLGDDLNDFVSVPNDSTPTETRATLVATYQSFWGTRWFLIPNPMYGSWERALGGTVESKLKALRP